MATKKNSATRATSDHADKPRRTKAAKTEAVSAATPTQAEAAPAGMTEAPVVATPEASPSAPEPPRAASAATRAETAAQPAETKKLSVLEAAVRVLAETGQVMSCPELIAAMAARGYWGSPRGRTPAATLYSSLLRELQTKGEQARFVKTQRGKFALRGKV
jgi:hypothetical protein